MLREGTPGRYTQKLKIFENRNIVLRKKNFKFALLGLIFLLKNTSNLLSSELTSFLPY